MTGKGIVAIALIMFVGTCAHAQLPGQAQPPAIAAPAAAPSGSFASQSNFPAEMTLIKNTEARSGPTPKHYPTNQLPMYARVIVRQEVKEQPGWLAIAPPPGSVSFIQAKYVKRVPNGLVGYIPEEFTTVPVRPGSFLPNQKLEVEPIKITPGSQVVILGGPFQVEGEAWLQIQPPPNEVRFIPAEAVQLPVATPAVAITPSSPGTFPNTVAAPGNLIDQGDKYLNAGNKDMARQLYQQAINQATDPIQRTAAYNRLVSLGLGAPTQNWQPSPNQPNPQVPIFSTSMTQPPKWSSWGTLRKTPFNKDGQAVFVLENRQGQQLLYAVAQPGTTLASYVGQLVCLYGPITYRSEDYPRVQYMMASHVAQP